MNRITRIIYAPLTFWFRDEPIRANKPGKNNLHIRIGNLINDSYNQPNESGLLGPIKILQKQTYKKQ